MCVGMYVCEYVSMYSVLARHFLNSVRREFFLLMLLQLILLLPRQEQG